MDKHWKHEPIYFTPPDGSVREKWKSSPSPPPPPPVPDPAAQITAQAKALPSVYGPGGSQVYSGDPNTVGSFQRQDTLSPEQQSLFDAKQRVAQAILGRTESAIPQMPAGPYQFTGERYSGNFAPDLVNPATNKYFQAQKSLLDPIYERDESRLIDRLSNQGLPTGGEAYDKEFENFRRSKSQAYEQAAANAIGQGLTQEQAVRQQNINEQQMDFARDIAERQQTYNEIAAALGGAQLTPIGGGGNPIDVSSALAAQQAGLNRRYQGDLAAYNSEVASNNATTGGLFSLGAAAVPLIFSDRRLKRDVSLIGEIWPGVNWYAFHYIWDAADAPLRYGVMADEIILVMPDAVMFGDDGYAMVDYAKVFQGRTVH